MNKLNIKTPNLEVNIETEEIAIIKGLLNNLVYNNESAENKEQPIKEEPKKKEAPEPKKLNANEIKRKPLYTAEEIAELNKDYFETGVKYTPYGKKYRCRYGCPNCKSHGTHYVVKDKTTEVNCHQCKTPMQIRSVKEITNFTKDKNKNFYVAGDVIPSI